MEFMFWNDKVYNIVAMRGDNAYLIEREDGWLAKENVHDTVEYNLDTTKRYWWVHDFNNHVIIPDSPLARVIYGTV